MKKWVFTGVLVTILLFFAFAEKSEGDGKFVPAVRENVSLTKNKDMDTQQRIELLRIELKSRTCILPRRTMQPDNHTIDRMFRSKEKTGQRIRLKSENRLWKVLETVSSHQTLSYYTLLCRKGYYVYTLRKLLI
jgi:hypothetical protein